ncbi:MAG: triose-phosphate isomerase [Planctomycetes bacterium]|nr:triose-phosphate isomerase [Planctomycetota bacterium]
MRKPFIAGNWKMNMLVDTGKGLVAQLKDRVRDVKGVEIAICPPAVLLPAICEEAKGSNIRVGAQNMYHENSGAFTGEVSGAMLKSIGCTYVILGHSERRHIFGEPDGLINAKVNAALAIGLKPILCVGEKLEQREAGRTEDVVGLQVVAGLYGVTAQQMEDVVIAYEPVWAIGTGKTATPSQAEEVHQLIRGLVTETYGEEVGQSLRIQYGGSVKPDNARGLLGLADIDGALVGGASLEAEPFSKIVMAAVE